MPYPLWPLYFFAAVVAIYAAWPTISAMTPGAGSFVGALTGLLAILAGALYNARLNRKRDERLVLHDCQVLIASLEAEALLYRSGITARLAAYRNLEKEKHAPEVMDLRTQGLEPLFRFPQHPVFDSTLVRLGVLGTTLASALAHNYGIIDNTELTRSVAFKQGVSFLKDGELIARFEAALDAAERNCTNLNDAAKNT